MSEKMPLSRTMEWVAAVVCVSVATVFAVIKFAYSDFETQRNSDLYRQQLEKRLDNFESGLDKLNDKIDRLLSRPTR
jgi:hypothetical protein